MAEPTVILMNIDDDEDIYSPLVRMTDEEFRDYLISIVNESRIKRGKPPIGVHNGKQFNNADD